MVILSGRPLILDPAERERVDAIVAAWLPGSEGAGVADHDRLYPFGYGLTTPGGRR